MSFELRDVAWVLDQTMGGLGFWGFALGLFGAGISSALTIPIGTVMTLEDLYGLQEQPGRYARRHLPLEEEEEAVAAEAVAAEAEAAEAVAAEAVAAEARRGLGRAASLPASGASSPGGTKTDFATAAPGAAHSRGGSDAAAAGAANTKSVEGHGFLANLRDWRLWRTWSRARRWRTFGRPLTYTAFLFLSLVPSLLRLPTLAIITIAQITNGVLLPIVASMLLLSLNHSNIMNAAGPQAMCLNCVMLPCVGITVYLASVVLLKQTIGRAIGGAEGTAAAIFAALPVAACAIAALIWKVHVVRNGSMHGRAANSQQRSPRPTTAEPPPRSQIGGMGGGGRGVRMGARAGLAEVTLSPIV